MVLVTGERRGASDLLTAVLRAGLDVADITMQEPSLQSVFIKLTGRDLRDYASAMSTVLAVIRKDLLRRLRSPLSPAIYLLFPDRLRAADRPDLRRSGRRSRRSSSPSDEDGGLAARFLRSSVRAGPGADPFRHRGGRHARATGLIEDNKISRS